MILFVILLFIATVATIPEITPGPCSKNINVVQDFNVTRYAGKWYETHRYDTYNELFMDCVSAHYTLNETGHVEVHNEGVFNKTRHMIDGTAELTDPPKNEGKLSVKFPNATSPSPYWVLDTDYDNFAVVYSCTENENKNTVITWLLSRKTVIDGPSLEKIIATLTKNGIKWNPFRPTLHTLDACNGSSLPTLAVAVATISALLSKFL